MDSQTIAQQLADYDAKPVTSTDALNAALTQYGVPEIRNTVSGLRTTLANTQNAYNSVDPSVTGRTQGSLVTEAQRSRQVANERAPIAGQITDQSRALDTANADLTDKQNQASTLASNRVNDYIAGRQALQSRYDTTYKREQDQASAQTAAQDAAEKIREFNVGAAQKASDSANGGGGTPSSSQIKSAIQQGLGSVAGKDGYVSPQDYAQGLKAWLNAGLPRAEFNKQYSSYRNPKNSYYDYAIKQAGL